MPGGRRGRTARIQEETIESIRLEQGPPGSVTPFLLIPCQEIPHFARKNREVPLDDTPDNLIGYARIPVNQSIPERNDQRCIGDPLTEAWLPPEELVQCFADDLELPLDSRPQHGIGTILLKGSSGGELRDIVGGPGNIVEILLCFTRRHRHLCRFLPRTHGRSGF